jgi:RNA polymerase sigma factor (sigma-70 family)
MTIKTYVSGVEQATNHLAQDRVRQQAFSELVTRFQGMVPGCAIGLLNDTMLVDDAVQETFISAWQNLEKLRKPEAFPAWLRRIVVWQCFYYKRHAPPVSVSLETLEMELPDQHDLEDEVAQDDLNLRVRRYIGALPGNTREILILHYIEAYSHEEIAQFLDISPGAVRKRLHDAHKKIKAPLTKLLEGAVPPHRSPQRGPFGGDKMSTKDTHTQPIYRQRTAEEIIDSMIKPASCEQTEEGRLTWDMFCAAIRNDVDTLKQHIAEDPERARLEFWYTPPIHFAVREGHLDAVQVLWKAYPYDKVTKLIHLADDRGHEVVAGYLREQIGGGAFETDLCLHEAVESGNMEEVDRLLAEDPALTEQRDPSGRTVLHIAAIHRHGGLIERLIKHEAPIDAVDHQGYRPIHYVYWEGGYWNRKEDEADLASLLLVHGACDTITLAAARGDIDAVNAFLQQDRTLANDGDTLQKRPISAAVEIGRHDIVRLLLDHDADPTLFEGRNCPHGSALMTASVHGDLELAQMLLDAGADPNGGIDSSGTPTVRAESDAMRALMYSHGGKPGGAWGYIQRGDIETVAVILQYVDDPFALEEAEYLTTPYTAIISGYSRSANKGDPTEAYEGMLRLFLQRKYPIPKALTECKSYLYAAPAMTRQLLENGLDPNLPDWQCRTPMHDFASVAEPGEAQFELMDMFIGHGADINLIDAEDCSTPLGIAARVGDKRMVQYLLDHGADPDKAGAGWATPVAWAEKRGHGEIVEMLRG